METFKNGFSEAIVIGIHNMCFSDKILFLKARFKVTQQWELLKK